MPNPDVDTRSAGERVAAQTVCLTLRRGKFGNRRQASLSTVTTDADKALIGLRKTLLVSPELTAIASLDNECTTYLDRARLPAPYKFTAYTYLLALGLVEEVDARLHEFQARRQPLIDAAVLAYPTRMRETAERLGSLTALNDYPTAERFRASFYMEWEYIEMATPTSLQRISPMLLASERAKAAARLDAVAVECQAAMRAGLQNLVDKMVTTLTPGPDGKPRRFHPSVVAHFSEFLRTFDMKNEAVDDAALAALAAQARDLLAGVDVEILRTDPGSRVSVAASFHAMQAALVPLVGSRAISFDDEAG